MMNRLQLFVVKALYRAARRYTGKSAVKQEFVYAICHARTILE
jgi:hypothetical protein